MSADELFESANDALGEEGLSAWVLLDRLDVAFAETPELEANALRALFRVCIDLAGYDHITTKIFLRDDIWRRITREGFREASHITRDTTLSWDDQSLLNLIVRRAISNESVQRFYGVKPTDILNHFKAQERLFYRIFPAQVEAGSRRPNTLRWMLTHVADGSGNPAPRQLIHLLDVARERQLGSIEVGQPEPSGETMITGPSIQGALADVSTARLEQTLFAEYPDARELIEKLEGRRTEQSIETLAKIWEVSQEEAIEHAVTLVDIGFFTPRERTYWVPFLYRGPLNMVQGREQTP